MNLHRVFPWQLIGLWTNRCFWQAPLLAALCFDSALAQEESTKELFVPIMVNGMVDENFHFQTLFRFMELSGTTASPAITVEMDAFDNEGSAIHPDQFACPGPVPFPGSTLSWSLSGSGSTHSGTKGFVQPYEPAPGLIDGWIRIRYSGPGSLQVSAEIAGVRATPVGCPPLVCSRPSSEYESDALVQALSPSKAFRVPTVATPQRHAAFSIVNPSADQEADVRISFYDSEGVLLGQEGFTVLPLHRVSRFAAEFANLSPPEIAIGIPVPWYLPERYYGSVLITADIPIVVGALQVLFPEGKLVSASVTPVD